MFIPKSFLGSGIIKIISLSVFLTACSTTVYDSEIMSFKSSTDGVINAMKNYATAAAKIRRQNKLYEFSEDKKIQIRLSDTCEKIKNSKKRTNEKCFVKIVGRNADGKDEIFKIEKEKPDFTLLNSLARYANNLEKTASSKGSQKVVNSIGELSSAVASFAKANNSSVATKKQVDAVIGPLTTIFQWITGNYLNYKRWQALKEATSLVNPELKKAKNKLTDLAFLFYNNYVTARLIQADRLLNIHLKSKGEAKAMQMLVLQSEAYKITKEINSQPAKMFETMVNAHDGLTRAIADPSRQIETIFTALNKFKNAVDDTKDAFKKED